MIEATPPAPMHERPLERWFLAVVLLVLWAGIYGAGLGESEFVHEEGRRALSAQEMGDRGEYLVPAVLDKTYLNKPPGYPWLVLAVSKIAGGIDEWSVRFTSVFGTAVSALLLFVFARDVLALRIRFLGAAIFLLTFMSLEKGRLGEIEAVFTTGVWASLACAWYGFQADRKWLWWIASGACLGGSVLVKGPPALVFYYGTMICFCLQTGRLKWFVSRYHFAAFATVCAIFCSWLIPAIDSVGWDALVETGSREMLQRGGYNAAEFFDEHSKLISNSFVGLLPGSFFFLAYFWRKRWREPGENVELQTFLLCAALSGWFFFAYYPGARARYLYPIAPAVALLGAIVWSRVCEKASLHALATVFYCVVGVMGVVGIGTLYGLSAILHDQITLLIFLGAASLILSVCMRAFWSKRLSFAAIFLQLTLIGVLSASGVLAQSSKQRFVLPIKQSAMLLSTFVPDGETLYTLTWSQFNLFYYVENPVRYIPSLNELKRDGREYCVSFHHMIDRDEFDRWTIVDYQTIALAKNRCVWAVKIR